MLLLVGDWGGVGQGGVAALTVVEDLDEVEDRRPQPGSGRPGVPVEQLAFQGREKLSATALSSASPTVPIEATSSEAAKRRPNANEVYWQPWSVWWIRPGAGRR